MLVKFEDFFYENFNGIWYFIGDIDEVIETDNKTEVKNIRLLDRLKLKFKV